MRLHRKDTKKALGPVQLLVVAFDGTTFTVAIRKELERLRKHDIVRLIDLLLIRKDADGRVEALERSDLRPEEAEEVGALVGALIGFGAGGEEGASIGAVMGAAELADGHAFSDADVWYVADAIPDGTAAAIVLLEHRWAIALRETVEHAGGALLAAEWVHAADLVAVGFAAAEERI